MTSSPPKRLNALRLHHAAPADTVETLHADLRSAGLIRLERMTGPEALQSALIRDDPHAVLIDMDWHEEDFLNLVYRLRRARFAGDPFIVLIAARSEVTSDVARRYAAGGVDQILMKPHPGMALVEHLVQIASRPRRFIADKGYVGPDRRVILRDPGQMGVMEVPNRIAYALKGEAFDPEAYEARVAAWREKLTRVEMI